MRHILGLDIGGANLKAAHTDGTALSRSFALWKHPADLPAALADLIAQMPPHDALAVTMTGELCDCWESRAEGVVRILAAIAPTRAPVWVWTHHGKFLTPDAATHTPLSAASANWLALATYAGRLAPHGSALLLDMGTTTTDIVPLQEGRPRPLALDDPDRLSQRELLYFGWRRTPLCAILHEYAAELFATMHDVCLILGLAAEDANDRDTADGRPATRAYAERRFARLWCGEPTPTLVTRRAELALQRIEDRLREAIQLAETRLGTPAETMVLSGSGECVLRRMVAGRQVRSLTEHLGPGLSSAACAYAVAVLLAEAHAAGGRGALTCRVR